MVTFDFQERFNKELTLTKLSQNEIAKRCDIDPSCITQYKQGKSFPSIKILFKLCLVLEVSADYLLGLTNR